MAATLEDLLAAQRIEAAGMEEEEQRRVLVILRRAQDSLHTTLYNTLPRGGIQMVQVASALAQVKGVLDTLERELDGELYASKGRQAQRAESNLREVLAAYDEMSPIRFDIIADMSAEGSLLLHRHSLARYKASLINDVQAYMVRGVATKTDWYDMAKGIEGILDVNQHRAQLISRMENMSAYDRATNKMAQDLPDPNTKDPYMMMADEHIDGRNHPFSRLLDKQLRPLDGVWKVPVSSVRALGKSMKVSSGGVVWPNVGGVYQGASYPAHFNDRGSATTVRASWLKEKTP